MNNSPTLFPFFCSFVNRQRWTFFFMALTITAWPMTDMVIPYTLKHIIEIFRLAEDNRVQALYEALPYGLILCGMYLLAEIMFRAHDWLAAKTLPRFRADITTAMFDYAKEHSHRYFSDHFAGSIANQVTKLSAGMSAIVSDAILVFVPVCFGIGGSLIIISFIAPFFATMFVLWFMAFAAVAFVFLRKTISYSITHSETVTALNGVIVDIFSNISAVRFFARSPYERQYFDTRQSQERQASETLQLFVFKQKLFLGLISAVMCVFWWGAAAYCWYRQDITLGQLAQLVLLLWSMIGFTWFSLPRLSGFFEQVGICQEALHLLSVEHEIKDVADAAPLVVTRGEIIFDQVHFHYIPGKDIFSNKNLTIHAGEKIGLVGFSGSGKTTFAHLILRLFDVESGRILIDGQDIRTVTQASLRTNIAMIPQDTSLFHRSLMENIRYGRLDATNEEVIKAAKQAHCHEFIEELPDGYNTLVGERGVKLSGGQRQRIAIARALLKNASILIMDEATSSLDSLTETYIQDSFDQLVGHRTTIVIAHRLSTLSRMDRILVFAEGEIIEEGSHEALLTMDSHYAELWKRQAGGFLPDQKKSL